MSNVNFIFDAAGGTSAPNFDLDISNVYDIDTLKRVIGANFGVVEPEGHLRRSCVVWSPDD